MGRPQKRLSDLKNYFKKKGLNLGQIKKITNDKNE